MLDFILNFLAGWLALSKTPMSPRGRLMWAKMRRLGFVPFVLLFTFGLGGFMAILDIFSDMPIGHQSIDGVRVFYQAVWWLLGGLMGATGEWHLNETRFELPLKSASALEDSKRHSRMWVP